MGTHLNDSFNSLKIIFEDHQELSKEVLRKFAGLTVWKGCKHGITKTCPCNQQRFFELKKLKKSQLKIFDIFFFIFAQNIDCGYMLEPPRRGGSNEYPQSMFWSKQNKKNR